VALLLEPSLFNSLFDCDAMLRFHYISNHKLVYFNIVLIIDYYSVLHPGELDCV